MPIRLAQLRQEPNQPANRAVRRIATASDWLSRANRFLIARNCVGQCGATNFQGYF